MAINVIFTLDNDTLRVTASGFDEDLEGVEAYGLSVIEQCIATRCRHVLCDELGLEYRIGTYDTYEAARFIAERAPSVARIAIVTRPGQIEDARFWETVVVNRGMLARAFTSLDDAERWLTE